MAGYGLKINAAALDASARESAAALLDDHADEVDALISASDLKPGEMLAARTSATQARLLSIELRGAQTSDTEALRAQLAETARRLAVATAELERLRALHQG
jgi:Mor family transcriptional regulator